MRPNYRMSTHRPNFLETSSPSASSPIPPTEISSPAKPTRRRVSVWKWLIISLVVVLIVVTTPAAIAFTRAMAAIRSAQTTIAQARMQAQALDFVAAQASVVAARAALGEAHDDLQGVGFWRQVPGVGTQVRALEDVTTVGSQTLDGVSDVADIFSQVTEALRAGVAATSGSTMNISPTRSYQDLSADEKRDLLVQLTDRLPTLRVARDKVDLALELWNRIPQTELFAPLRDAIHPFATTLPVLKQTLDQSVPLLEVGLPFAGATKPMHVLIILQNANELRPAGGFLGTLGEVTIDKAALTQFEFGDVYSIDQPVATTWKEAPPDPIAKELGTASWFLRDANWSPDFPTSADRVLDFYTRERALAGRADPTPPDTVIALEPGVFSALLSITGPVSVHGETFDAANFTDKLEFDVEQGFSQRGIPVDQRKAILQQLGTAIVTKLSNLPASRWPEVINAVTLALNQKQILLDSHQPEILAAEDRYGWTGRAKATNGDFLWVVDANLGALKTDAVMDKRVTYQVDAKDPAHPMATVTLNYANTNHDITWQYTRYRSYTRIYVPEGSMLVSSSGTMKDDLHNTGGVLVPGVVDVTKELGKTVFGAFWAVEPGKAGTLSFTYQLPPASVESLSRGAYHLDWPKQPGADKTRLTLDLLFGKNVVSATPPESQNKWGDARYQVGTDTSIDRTFDLQF